jgi:hypothetical protein
MRFAKKWVFLVISLIHFLLFAPTLGAEMDTSDGPPIFHIVSNTGIDIYIIGSPHTIPIKYLFDEAVLGVLHQIVQLKTHLFIEHTINADAYLQYVHENPVEKDDNFQRIPLSPTSKGILRKMVSDPINSHISEGQIVHSRFTFDLLQQAPLYMLTPILSLHFSVFTFQKFGGLEYELLTGAAFKPHWLSVDVLEHPAEVIKSAIKYQESDEQNNKKRCNQNLIKISTFWEGTSHKLGLMEDEMKEFKAGYSWTIIEDSMTPIHDGARARSRDWADNLLAKIKHVQAGESILIVVGEGHMYGTGEYAANFLDLIMVKVGARELKRLTQHGNWTIVTR